MPELSGLDLAREAARLRPGCGGAELRVCLRKPACRGPAAGVRHVLQKEYTLDRLGALVHDVLAERSAS